MSVRYKAGGRFYGRMDDISHPVTPKAETVEEAFEAFKVKAHWPHATAAGCIGTAFKAGYERAERMTEEQQSVIRAARELTNWTPGQVMFNIRFRLLMGAVAALEREKVEGACNGDTKD